LRGTRGYSFFQQADEIVDLDAGDLDAFRAAGGASHQLDRGRLDAERRGDKLEARLVRPASLWRRGDPNLERIAVPSDDRGATGARLHVQAQKDGPVVRNVEELLDHDS
jgi:hypothetical protein